MLSPTPVLLPPVWFLENAFTLDLCVTGGKVWPGDTAPCCHLQPPEEVFPKSISGEGGFWTSLHRRISGFTGKKVSHRLKYVVIHKRSASEKNNSHLSRHLRERCA